MPQNPKILEALTERNGPYSIDPTPEQINDFFTLTVDELEMIAPCRHNHTRLGMAIQVCTLKFLSTFPTDVTRVPKRKPASIIKFRSANGLGIGIFPEFLSFAQPDCCSQNC
jgi:hypothetical protein